MSKSQTIFRVAHRKLPFSQIGNGMLRDTKLSYEARGALAMILTYPSDWQFSVEWFQEMGGIGRDQARRIVKELEAHKYCVRKRIRTPDGLLGPYVFSFTDQPGTIAQDVPACSEEAQEGSQPQPEKPSVDETSDGATSDGKTSDGKPVTGNQLLETDPLQKKENKHCSKYTPPNPLASEGEREEPDFAFEEFWELYPKGKRSHTKEHSARKAWEAILAGKHREGLKATADEIMDGCRRYRGSLPDPDYVPSAVNWLNGARWRDQQHARREAPDTTAHDTEGGREGFTAYLKRMIAEGKANGNDPRIAARLAEAA